MLPEVLLKAESITMIKELMLTLEFVQSRLMKMLEAEALMLEKGETIKSTEEIIA